jgi:hypothetical protein
MSNPVETPGRGPRVEPTAVKGPGRRPVDATSVVKAAGEAPAAAATAAKARGEVPDRLAAGSSLTPPSSIGGCGPRRTSTTRTTCRGCERSRRPLAAKARDRTLTDRPLAAKARERTIVRSPPSPNDGSGRSSGRSLLAKARNPQMSGRSLSPKARDFQTSARELSPKAGDLTRVRSVAFAKSRGPDKRPVGRFRQ